VGGEYGAGLGAVPVGLDISIKGTAFAEVRLCFDWIGEKKVWEV
jgi:hypothetical protein